MSLDAITNKSQYLLSSPATADDGVVCCQTWPTNLICYYFIIVVLVCMSTEHGVVLADISMHYSGSHISR